MMWLLTGGNTTHTQDLSASEVDEVWAKSGYVSLELTNAYIQYINN